VYPTLTEFEERLYHQGWQMLIHDGVRAFTVENLSRRLGVSKKTIYKTVTSKEDLIEKIVNYTLSKIKNRILITIAEEPNPVKQFIAIGELLSNFLSHVQDNRILELKIKYPKVWQLIEDFRFERREQFFNILFLAEKQGLIKPDFDIDIVVTLFMQLLNSVFQPEFFVQNNLIIPNTIRLFFKIISEGIFTAEGIKHVESV